MAGELALVSALVFILFYAHISRPPDFSIVFYILGQGGPKGAKGNQLAWGPLWDPRHFFEASLFHPLAEPIFHTVIQIASSLLIIFCMFM